MPIYAYKCKDCGEEAEYIQKFSDPPMTECEACGGHIEKQITAAAFHLKGGGWYKDGYASAKTGSGGDAKASSTDAGDKKASKPSDAKASSTSGTEPSKPSKGSKKSA